MKFIRRHVIGAIAAVGIGASAFLPTLAHGQDRTGGNTVSTAAAAPGGPFSLTDHLARAVTDRDYRGKFMLVFFGYTMCPDICPTTLLDITAVMEKLGDVAGKVQPLFITIDPKRDSAGVLKEYLSSFDSRIVGLTGSPEEIQRVANAYRVFYAKFKTGDGNYTVDHSGYIYLMDSNGKYLTHFVHGASVAAMANDIRDYINHMKLSTRK